MVYGFKKGCYDLEQLKAMDWGTRFALAKQDEQSGKTCIFNTDEVAKERADLFWFFDTLADQELGPIPAKEPRKVFVLVYSAFNENEDEGLYSETRVFDSLEKAIAQKEVYIKDELTSEGNHFQSLLDDACDGNLGQFQNDYVKKKSERAYHMIDTVGGDYRINIDIFEQIVL